MMSMKRAFPCRIVSSNEHDQPLAVASYVHSSLLCYIATWTRKPPPMLSDGVNSHLRSQKQQPIYRHRSTPKLNAWYNKVLNVSVLEEPNVLHLSQSLAIHQ